jgi:hypothetical protein
VFPSFPTPPIQFVGVMIQLSGFVLNERLPHEVAARCRIY